MKTLKYLDVKRRGVFLITVLLLTVLLMGFLKGLAYRAIVVPILYVLWLADLALRIIPQPILWALFMVVVFTILIKSLPSSQTSKQSIHGSAVRYLGRVEKWARRIHYAKKWGYSQWNLACYLADLASEILAFRERCALTQIRDRLQNGTLDANQNIRAYFQAGLAREIPHQIGFFSKVRQRLRGQKQVSPLDLDPENVVHFLENQLEIHYDDENH